MDLYHWIIDSPTRGLWFVCIVFLVCIWGVAIVHIIKNNKKNREDKKKREDEQDNG